MRIAYFRLVFVAAVAVLIIYSPLVWIAGAFLGFLPGIVAIIFVAVGNFVYAVSRIPAEVRSSGVTGK